MFFLSPNMFSFVSEPCYVAFHDEEWGVPVHDDKYVGLFWCWHNLLFSFSASRLQPCLNSQCGNLVLCAGNCSSCSASLEPWQNLRGPPFLTRGSYFGTDIFSAKYNFMVGILHTHQKRFLIRFPSMCFCVAFVVFKRV